MAEQKLTDTLEEWKSLLREGRVQEVDNQIEALRVKTLADEAEAAKKKPPPEPRTLKQLQIDFADTVTDILGNPPRLISLLVELRGELLKPEQ
jgi:nitroimidazol reductase NimA-like FMN-containing flavoprotein (pyridoxamine 5'-phosphate oxidase superfamily)